MLGGSASRDCGCKEIHEERRFIAVNIAHRMTCRDMQGKKVARPTKASESTMSYLLMRRSRAGYVIRPVVWGRSTRLSRLGGPILAGD
ncbi:hypothetical protein J6590_049170 [Homalodisca vitripennis]|nr:hypothetical protein J6590_049170 [Homalodisca vitripennis]